MNILERLYLMQYFKAPHCVYSIHEETLPCHLATPLVWAALSTPKAALFSVSSALSVPRQDFLASAFFCMLFFVAVLSEVDACKTRFTTLHK